MSGEENISTEANGSSKKDTRKIDAEMLDAAFQDVVIRLAILDREFSFVRVNKAFAKLARRSANDLSGRKYFECFPSMENVDIFINVMKTKNPFTAWAKPVVQISPDGRTRYWDWSLTPEVDETGTVNHLVLSWTDATEREEARADL